jgi:hypothetical protein
MIYLLLSSIKKGRRAEETQSISNIILKILERNKLVIA